MKYSARITSEELEKMGFVAFEGNVQVITEVGEEFFKAIKYLKEQRVIGFDTETKPCFIQKMPRNRLNSLRKRDGLYLPVRRVSSSRLPKVIFMAKN